MRPLFLPWAKLRSAMTTRRRMGLILVAIVTILLIALIFVLPAVVNPEHYRLRVISYLQEKTGKQVEIGRLGVTFFPKVSIRIDDFGVRNPPLFPSGYIVKVARIDAELDAGALLHRQVAIKSLILEDPIVDLTSDPDGPWNFENPQSNVSGNSFPLGVISRVQIKRGQLTASNLLPSDAAGPIFLEAHEISSELEQVDLVAITNPSSSSLDGQGYLKAGRLRFGSIEATGVNSKLRLQARQVFFTEVRAKLYGGNATGSLSFKLSGKNASFKTSARITGIDMDDLLAAFRNARGKLTGRMEGDLKLEGEMEHSLHPLGGMRGTGHVTVRNGQAPSLKLNANLMKLAHFNDLGPAKQDPSSFSYISTDLKLANLRISSSAIDIDGYGVDVDGWGNVSVSGSDDLNYQGVAKIIAKQSFFTNTFARMSGATLTDGKLSFPFRIGGTIEVPIFSKGTKTN